MSLNINERGGLNWFTTKKYVRPNVAQAAQAAQDTAIAIYPSLCPLLVVNLGAPYAPVLMY